MRSLVAVPPSRQAAEPSPAQASLPCCLTGDAPALRRHLAPSHGARTTLCHVPGSVSGTGMDELRQVINMRLRHGAIAAVPCVSTQ